MSGCLNGGSCELNEVKQTFTCSCKTPWSGEKCEIKIGKIENGIRALQIKTS